MDKFERKLGRVYAALVYALANVDPNSEDGQEIGAIFLKLNEFCDQQPGR
jgi:hypothetical protein